MTMYVVIIVVSVNEQREIRSGTLDLLGRHSIGFDLLRKKSFDLISPSSLSSARVRVIEQVLRFGKLIDDVFTREGIHHDPPCD